MEIEHSLTKIFTSNHYECIITYKQSEIFSNSYSSDDILEEKIGKYVFLTTSNSVVRLLIKQESEDKILVKFLFKDYSISAIFSLIKNINIQFTDLTDEIIKQMKFKVSPYQMVGKIVAILNQLTGTEVEILDSNVLHNVETIYKFDGGINDVKNCKTLVCNSYIFRIFCDKRHNFTCTTNMFDSFQAKLECPELSIECRENKHINFIFHIEGYPTFTHSYVPDKNVLVSLSNLKKMIPKIRKMLLEGTADDKIAEQTDHIFNILISEEDNYSFIYIILVAVFVLILYFVINNTDTTNTHITTNNTDTTNTHITTNNTDENIS